MRPTTFNAITLQAHKDLYGTATRLRPSHLRRLRARRVPTRVGNDNISRRPLFSLHTHTRRSPRSTAIITVARGAGGSAGIVRRGGALFAGRYVRAPGVRNPKIRPKTVTPAARTTHIVRRTRSAATLSFPPSPPPEHSRRVPHRRHAAQTGDGHSRTTPGAQYINGGVCFEC